MNKQTASKFTNRKLLGVLTLAASLAAFSPLAAHAQDDRPGNDMAHQGRNPSQRPDLFTMSARGSQSAQAPEAVTAPRTARRKQAKVEGRAIYFVTPATPTLRETTRSNDDRVGNGAPHQERNPSAHPELFVLGANR